MTELFLQKMVGWAEKTADYLSSKSDNLNWAASKTFDVAEILVAGGAEATDAVSVFLGHVLYYTDHTQGPFTWAARMVGKAGMGGLMAMVAGASAVFAKCKRKVVDPDLSELGSRTMQADSSSKVKLTVANMPQLGDTEETVGEKGLAEMMLRMPAHWRDTLHRLVSQISFSGYVVGPAPPSNGPGFLERYLRITAYLFASMVLHNAGWPILARMVFTGFQSNLLMVMGVRPDSGPEQIRPYRPGKAFKRVRYTSQQLKSRFTAESRARVSEMAMDPMDDTDIDARKIVSYEDLAKMYCKAASGKLTLHLSKDAKSIDDAFVDGTCLFAKNLMQYEPQRVMFDGSNMNMQDVESVMMSQLPSLSPETYACQSLSIHRDIVMKDKGMATLAGLLERTMPYLRRVDDESENRVRGGSICRDLEIRGKMDFTGANAPSFQSMIIAMQKSGTDKILRIDGLVDTETFALMLQRSTTKRHGLEQLFIVDYVLNRIVNSRNQQGRGQHVFVTRTEGVDEETVPVEPVSA
jgi:hypothetical protein